MAKPSKSNKSLVTPELNETGRRKSEDRRKVVMQVEVERRKGNRRRNIDPTTCEREYSEAEIEFMRAMDEYKQANGRMFPTCSEILEVVMKLGYQKCPAAPTGNPVVTSENLFLGSSSTATH